VESFRLVTSWAALKVNRMSYRKLEQHLLDTIQDTFHHAGSWLSSTLALFPLLLLVLGLGLKTIPASEQAPTSSSYLLMAGWIIVLYERKLV
jgi:hypothetical protein